MVEVERILSRQGTIKSRLEEAGPTILVLVRPSLVRLADSSNPGIDSLEEKEVSS